MGQAPKPHTRRRSLLLVFDRRVQLPSDYYRHLAAVLIERNSQIEVRLLRQRSSIFWTVKIPGVAGEGESSARTIPRENQPQRFENNDDSDEQ